MSIYSHNSDVNWLCPVNWLHPLNEGLVSWWLAIPSAMGSIQWLDLADPSSGNHGTLTDVDPATDWVGGEHDSLSLDGTDDHVGIPSVPINPNDSCTIAAVFRVNGEATAAHKVLAFASTLTNPLFYLSVENALGDELVFDIRDDGGTLVRITSGVAVDDGEWHVGFGVRSLSSPYTRLYLDGNLVASSVSNPGTTTLNTANIGRLESGGVTAGGYFKGSIHSAMCWQRALSDGEVAEYTQLVRQRYPGLLNRVPMPRLSVEAAAATGDFPFRRYYQMSGAL